MSCLLGPMQNGAQEETDGVLFVQDPDGGAIEKRFRNGMKEVAYPYNTRQILCREELKNVADEFQREI